MRKSFIMSFFKTQSSAGIILFVSAMLALIAKNTEFSSFYNELTESSLHHWINDGLMAIFFFLVGLEIKREFVNGELSSIKTALLPIIGAFGGMMLPALFYLMITKGNPELLRGWAIPCATDIAFSLGILSLFGNRIKTSLKVFITALAIIDDLGAIVIIALFYTATLSLNFLVCALITCILLFVLNYKKFDFIPLYLLLSVVLWYFTLKSGIHATIAGVIAALFIPFKIRGRTPLVKLEKALHPYVAFLILPVFGFFNGGVDLLGLELSSLFSSLTLGITLGLFFGKQLGVFLFSWLAVKLNFAKKPTGAQWLEFYSVAILTGVGFTMSLFIDLLAFQDPVLQTPSRLGILSGSLLSGLVGMVCLYFSTRKSLVKN